MASLISFLGCTLGKFFLKTIVTSAAFFLIFHCLGCVTATEAAPTTATPAITQVLPQTIPAGSGSTTLKVTGTNFPSQAAILWNGTAVATTVVDANTLSGTVGPSNLATPSTAKLQVQNTQTMAASQAVPVVISPASTAPTPTALSISTTTIPQGVVGAAYTATLAAAGGTTPYTWSVSKGQLPAGLSLAASTGIISGTPTTPGNSSFSVTVVDSSSTAQTASIAFTMSVVAPQATPSALVVSTTSLPSGTIGAAYSATLQVSGGTAPYTWSIASGNIPAGLSLNTNTGLISGTPTASGTANFTASVTDSESPAQTKSVTLSIAIAPAAAPLTITSSTLPSGTQNSMYTSTLQATGGTGPYTWSLGSGSSLPAGLSLAASGAISGKPTGYGNFSFGVTVKDSGSPAQTVSATVTLSVVQAGSPLAIGTTTLPGGVPNQTYSTTLNATGGMSPYTWTLASGTLPAGLSFAASTGVISGTPTAIGTSSLTFSVTDSSSPQQTAKSVTLSLVVAPPVLAITTSSSLPSGAAGTAYSNPLTASGGTGAYTWSITVGTLPAGLTLAATTGIISGTPTTSGTSNFTATVTDNGSPAQTKSAATSIVVAAAEAPAGPGTTWFVRPDGGTRFSTNVPTGQCDGKADVAYPGTGTNQHCAFNDFRYMWDDFSGLVGAGEWVIAGGDTVVVRGCSALPSQMNPANPTCRIGWDLNNGGGPPNNWCYGVGNYTCYNPPIPAGTATQHTRILGGCAYGAYDCVPVNTYPLASDNLTQLFGGMGLVWTFNVGSTQYVDIQGIELTTHNGVCTWAGSPAYPRGCSNNPPLDDYAQNGFLFNNTSANIALQDVYVHGFTSAGLDGPIGGAISLTRVFSGFNAFAGWNFQDQSDTPNAAGSSIAASYVTMIGNGCYEQYPIVNTQFPAQACYDDGSDGFGDSWSGQDTNLDTFTCDHCVQMYNTKDGFIGPHAAIKTLTITNSASIGNMGQQWKWGGQVNSTVLFQNNLTVGNCLRMSETIPGAAQNFAESTGLPGSYLSDFCRAAGDTFDILTQIGSSNSFYGNTIVMADNTGIDYNCGPTGGGLSNCGAVPNIWQDNNFLGYTPASVYEGPGLWYIVPGSNINITSSYNNEFGIRNGDTCGTNNITCGDPMLVNEPVQPWPGTETDLDVFNPFVKGNSFFPASGSPLIGTGIAVPGLTTDYNGVTRPSAPTIGAFEP